YYDFLLRRPLAPEDLETITQGMRRQITADLPMRGRELSRGEAAEEFAGQPFKLEMLQEIPLGEAISTYRHGDFEDLCEGPHVAGASAVKAFKLLNIAGAYWRGDEKRPMLQRIYGTAFESQEALEDYLHRLEEAQRRDHRLLGKELGLFMMDPVAPASPFYLPKGAIVYNQLVEYVRGLYQQYGYQEVITPQIFDMEIWKRSGHYDYYRDNMFLVTSEEREFGVKPMNCPAHALIYGAQLHSYRELPLRLADFGRLHRFERSGVVQGLTRVRTFSQDDAHIFCAPEHIESEIHSLVQMFHDTYRLFNFERVRIVLSLRPDKRVGSDEMWDRAEAILAQALAKEGLLYTPLPGEGAFYGPKIDFFVPDALGREWQLGTIQLDFHLGQRFDLEYVAVDGTRQRPVVLHRAMLGSLDRFMGVLIEHYAGAFPVWLSPVQAVVIPIADRHNDYARQVEQRLRDEGIRVQVDNRSERMNAKIRDAQLQKAPYMLVVGDREQEAHAVAVRLRSGENPGSMPLDQAVAAIKKAVDERM
ncbi:MAG: threonine--tRNA ligase, partial [Chloroflexi bacterium]|nr:threonine--tRNA ligase [Chloroflexota bacterium]